jgi:hypothetical protein
MAAFLWVPESIREGQTAKGFVERIDSTAQVTFETSNGLQTNA